MTAESHRIGLLLARDGPEATRAWVKRTLKIYCQALDNPQSHASQPQYRPLFESAVEEFRRWLEQTEEAAPPMPTDERPAGG